MGDLYDVVVLGAGVQGSSTAYYLTQKAGVKNVLLLEQVNWNLQSCNVPCVRITLL